MVSIAIDGPAGAGKSTIAKLLAKRMGYIYVDTGALYRAIGLYATRAGADVKDENAVGLLLPAVRIELGYADGAQHIYMNGADVSQDIRSPEMSAAASVVSAHGCVRDFLLEMQRGMAERYNVIMDGRDIGTVVLPNAAVKLFLTARADARAKRRYDEYLAKGEIVRYNDILEDMEQRDFNDSNRAIAPLRQAADAVLIDTSEYSVQEAVDMVLRTLKERGIE